MAPISKTLALAGALFSVLSTAAPLNKRAVVWETVTDVVWTTIDTTITITPGQTDIPTPTGGDFLEVTSTASVVTPSSSSSAVQTPTPASSSSSVTPSSTIVPSSTAVPTTTAAPSTTVTPSTTAVPSTTAAPSTTADPSTTSTSSADPTTSSSVEAWSIQLSTSLALLPTTSSSAPAATSTASSSSSGGYTGVCDSGSPCSGDGTYYDTATLATNPSSCGTTNDGLTENVVALPYGIMTDAYCGKTITVKYGGATSSATVVDKCMGCQGDSIDMSRALFGSLASLDAGRLHGVEWFFDN